MPFSMSGNNNWSYNRFDAFDKLTSKSEEPKAEAESTEEETLEESSCGSKGYQKGGEVKCDKCDGKGCDHCDQKGTHKKSSKKGARPDYLDFDKDGDKEEPMTDALGEEVEALDEIMKHQGERDRIEANKKNEADRVKKARSAYGKQSRYSPPTKGVHGEIERRQNEKPPTKLRSGSLPEGYQRSPEKGEAEAKKYAPVRGEKTPMPPRGNKRREDFEKWYAANVKEGVDLSVFGDNEIEALAEALLGKN